MGETKNKNYRAVFYESIPLNSSGCGKRLELSSEARSKAWVGRHITHNDTNI